MTIQRGDWQGRDLVDMLDKTFKVGDRVARAYTSGRSANLELRTVTKIADGKLWLDNSHVPINYPGRLLIITGLTERRTCETCGGSGFAGGSECCDCDATGGV